MEKQPPSAPAMRQRLDKWLFFARLIKSRSLAQKAIEAGHVAVNGKRETQSSAQIKAGDMLEVSLERRDLVVRVLLPGSRRGPYEEARLLYEDLDSRRARRQADAFRAGDARPRSGAADKAGPPRDGPLAAGAGPLAAGGPGRRLIFRHWIRRRTLSEAACSRFRHARPEAGKLCPHRGKSRMDNSCKGPSKPLRDKQRYSAERPVRGAKVGVAA